MSNQYVSGEKTFTLPRHNRTCRCRKCRLFLQRKADRTFSRADGSKNKKLKYNDDEEEVPKHLPSVRTNFQKHDRKTV